LIAFASRFDIIDKAIIFRIADAIAILRYFRYAVCHYADNIADCLQVFELDTLILFHASHAAAPILFRYFHFSHCIFSQNTAFSFSTLAEAIE